jgi:hypothetical protein
VACDRAQLTFGSSQQHDARRMPAPFMKKYGAPSSVLDGGEGDSIAGPRRTIPTRTDSRTEVGRSPGMPARATGCRGDEVACRSRDAVTVMCGSRHVILSPILAPPISGANQNVGNQTGSQRRQTAGDAKRRAATMSSAGRHFKRHQATSRDGSVAPYKRGVTGSNPVAPTRFMQVEGLRASKTKEPRFP